MLTQKSTEDRPRLRENVVTVIREKYPELLRAQPSRSCHHPGGKRARQQQEDSCSDNESMGSSDEMSAHSGHSAEDASSDEREETEQEGDGEEHEVMHARTNQKKREKEMSVMPYMAATRELRSAAARS